MLLKLGKDVSFYLLLEAQADVAIRAAQVFRSISIDFSSLTTLVRQLTELEREGDELTHRLQDHVSGTFITPIDKEDLRTLSQTLDDITDAIEAVGARIDLYRLEQPRRDLVPLADLMVAAAEKVHQAVSELKSGFKSKSLGDKLIEIHDLEEDCDHLYRLAIQDLFATPGIDPLFVIKWKEIYDRVEMTMDYCEDIAKEIGTIIVKYA